MKRPSVFWRSATSLTLALTLSFIADSATAAMGTNYSGPLYNHVRAKSSHNSYERKESIVEQVVYHRIRSLEFDLNMDGTLVGDFEVYHPIISGDLSNNQCFTLSGCLLGLKAAHKINPEHEVITIFMDLKDGWHADPDKKQNRAGLDALLKKHLGGAILRPYDLLKQCPEATNLQKAVTRNPAGTDQDCRWPSLKYLQGRFIFVLTDKINQYADTEDEAEDPERMAFVAGSWETYSSLSQEEKAKQNFRVFFNHNISHDNEQKDLFKSIFASKFIGRAYHIDNQTEWNQAWKSNAHFLATNYVNYHATTWARTHNKNLWPFECIINVVGHECSATTAENVYFGVSLLVDSRDMHGDQDEGFFMRRFGEQITDDSGSPTTWRANIVHAESHVGDVMTKGCLIARAGESSTSTRAPYFAVCNTGNGGEPRIQWRLREGDDYGSKSVSGQRLGVNTKAMTFFKMECSSTGDANTVCRGYVSPDDITFYQIGEAKTFSTQLKFQGVSVSTNDKGQRKFYFENLRRHRPGDAGWHYFVNGTSTSGRREIGTVYGTPEVFDGLGDDTQPY